MHNLNNLTFFKNSRADIFKHIALWREASERKTGANTAAFAFESRLQKGGCPEETALADVSRETFIFRAARIRNFYLDGHAVLVLAPF